MRRTLPVLVAAGLLALSACAGNSTPGNSAAGSGVQTAQSGNGVGAAGGDPSGFGNANNPPTLAPMEMGGLTDPRGCNDLVVEFEPVIPTVIVLIDRSGSMFDSPYGGSATRWQALEQALMDPTQGTIASYQDEVRFGVMTYTGDPQGGRCPIVRSVAPALGNYDMARQLYDEESVRPTFKAETPTAAGLIAATQELTSSEDGTKHIILVTDGEPDDCRTPDPQCGQDASIAAIQAAFRDGIGTSVVGISSDVSAQHLQDLANAGRGEPVRPPDMQYMYNCINPGYATRSATYAADGAATGTAPIFQPADAQSIAEALDALIRGVAGCSFELNGEVKLEDAHLGTVLLDAQPLVYQDPNGWHMRDSRVLELDGDACARVQTQSDKLVISFPCDVVDVL